MTVTRGTDLTAIIDAINSHTLNAQVCLVISNRSQSGILTKAQANGIAHKHVSATGLTREQYDQILSDHFLDEGTYHLLLSMPPLQSPYHRPIQART